MTSPKPWIPFTVLFALGVAALPAAAADGKDIWPKVASDVKQDPEIESRVKAILDKMTVEEKVGQLIQAEIKSISPKEVRKYNIGSVLSGGGSTPSDKAAEDKRTWLAAAQKYYDESVKKPNKRAAIPVIWGIDAVHGHNNVVGATLFPHNIGLGAARNPGLIRQIGEVTAREVTVTGLKWTFAPTVAVARDMSWGRHYESYSENPALVAKYAEAMVVGLQGHPARGDLFVDDKVLATVKHFIGDGGTDGGTDQGNTIVSEEELFKIHGQGYVTGLRAGAQTVMASFNSWNGEKAHGSHYLLTEVLKNQMGFDGFVVGDWNGHEQIPGCSNASCPEAINAGVDMIMVPTDWRAFYGNTLGQVKNGTISMERLDDAVTRILRVKMRIGLFDTPPMKQKFAGMTPIIGHEKHRAIARKAVRQSLVLLKNEGDVLPIGGSGHVLIAGDAADDISRQSGGWSVSWQGRGHTNADFPGGTSIGAGIQAALAAAGGSSELSKGGSYQQKPDAAIVIFGETQYAEFEGDLKGNLAFTGASAELSLMKKLKGEGIPVVAVFLTGRPLHVPDYMDASDAFVAAWLPGSEGGGVADVLIGKADGTPNFDFRGKLSFSWPKRADQSSLNMGDEGYDPLFPYGYGLNYGKPTAAR